MLEITPEILEAFKYLQSLSKQWKKVDRILQFKVLHESRQNQQS